MYNLNPSKQLKIPIIKRDEFGQCNICKSFEKLTWDHVPPKGNIKINSLQQTTIFQNIIRLDNENQYLLTQNGVKFRTICSKCNNKLLGKKYDPILIDFSKEISLYIESPLILPNIVHIKTTPSSLIRAIFGHLLAAKGIYEDTTLDEKMRSFFLDENLNTPEGLKVFYWIYPYKDVIVIVRDIFMPAIRGVFRKDKIGCFSILKYYPIGFIVCDINKYEGLKELINTQKDVEINLPLSLNKFRHSQWPEIIDEGNYILGGQSIQSSIHATLKKK